MSIEREEQCATSLALGHGVDLPSQAARARAMWVAGREGRPPVLLVALLWARQCPDVVRTLECYLDALFADYDSTPLGWSEAQAARQVLAALNQQLFRQRQRGRSPGEFDAGLLLVQGDEAHFLQAGAIGLLRYQAGSLQSLAGRDDMQLGLQAELALVQHSLPLSAGQPLLLAPQALLGVADLHGFRSACSGLDAAQLPGVLAPLLKAPGAAVLLLPSALAEPGRVTAVERPAALLPVQIGLAVDGWTLLAGCPYGPAGQVFLARDECAREALLMLTPEPVDETFRQFEWALRRSSAASLPSLLSSYHPRRQAFLLFEAPATAVSSLPDWLARHGPVDGQSLLALLEQMIVAVRALQRRGVHGLLLDPRNILLDDQRRLLFLPTFAALLPGVARRPVPPEAQVLAPELRTLEATVDGRADQFGLAALVYWLLCGKWPEVALAAQESPCRYVPLGSCVSGLPAGWDGVLARALAPQQEARFAALSEFQQALQQPLLQADPPVRSDAARPSWQWALLGVLMVQLGVGLWLSLQG
nr:protein kinase [uncultured Pseudomonas sp.]